MAMSEYNKLGDIADMKEYLEDRCYMPGEIYDITGFFYQVFEPDTECRFLCAGERGAVHGMFVIAKESPKALEQIIYIETTDDKVDDCVRIDATYNNIEQVLKFMKGEIEKMSLDEFEKGATAKSLEEVFGIANIIMM